MRIELVDSHTHLDASDFDLDRADVIERARAAGVTRIVTIGAGDGFASAERAAALAEEHSFIWATAGVHPNDAQTPFDLAKLRAHAEHPRVVAIGETGLDFYRDWAPREQQERWFRAHIETALELKKPLVIHSRAAAEDCLAILSELQADAVGGVFHCYSEDADFATRLRSMNFMISVPGSVTFKKAAALRAAVAAVPLDQIMLETDAPYLAPEPHRGKRCECSFVVETARAVAAARGVPIEQIAEQTTRNAIRFFGLERACNSADSTSNS